MNKKEHKKSLEQYKAGIPIFGDDILEQLENLYIKQEDAEWTLVRKRDGLTKWSNQIGFIEWKEDGLLKELHKGSKGLEIGRSLILAPFNMQFTWQTTEITGIVSEYFIEGKMDIVTFKTNNSEYTLTRKVK